LAAGIAGGIFVVAWFIAANPRVGTPQIAGIVVAAAALLLGGSLFAAIHDEGGEKAAAEGAEGPAAEEPAVPGSIAVALSEWKVEPASQSAPADTVSFSVTNKGATVHNFKVIKTDLAPDRLPIRQAQADESQLEVVASIPEFVAGQTREVSAQLAAGKYVLICNVGGHYQLGMRAGFTVQ
ncbi:MAG TPA: hypothetical protein VNL15_04965, partial [Dehalococcoidia bacterium]|nr:hypothetical protein [Dehalococcoidia bacterium]